MKGPAGRLKFDIRRVWECPVCHRREFTSGEIVTLRCPCGDKAEPAQQIWMKLVEPEPAREPERPPEMPSVDPNLAQQPPPATPPIEPSP